MHIITFNIYWSLNIEKCELRTWHRDRSSRWIIAFKPCFSSATDLAANFGWDQFRIMPEIVSKLLCTAIASDCALCRSLWMESEKTPFCRTGLQFRTGASHRLWLWTCGFVSMSYFYPESNEWSKDRAKQWAPLWSATSSCEIHWKAISDESRPKIY